MFALILESLGSTELLFILAIALIFFGPRKLPQLARTMGKGLAEFRKASDDFKRTWEREVAMETAQITDAVNLDSDQSYAYEPTATNTEPTVDTPALAVEAPDPEQVVARESTVHTASDPILEVPAEIPTEPVQPEPVRKQDWL